MCYSLRTIKIISVLSPDIYNLNEFSAEIDSLDLQNEAPRLPMGEGGSNSLDQIMDHLLFCAF